MGRFNFTSTIFFISFTDYFKNSDPHPDNPWREETVQDQFSQPCQGVTLQEAGKNQPQIKKSLIQYVPSPESRAPPRSPPAPPPQIFPAVTLQAPATLHLPALPQSGKHLVGKAEGSLTLQTSSQTRRVCPPALRLSSQLTTAKPTDNVV